MLITLRNHWCIQCIQGQVQLYFIDFHQKWFKTKLQNPILNYKDYKKKFCQVVKSTIFLLATKLSL